jgi:hypothetical protein
MTEITRAYMTEMLGKSRLFTALLLKMTDKYDLTAGPDSEQRKTIWLHGKRNFELRDSGVMPIVGPLLKPPYAGFAIFTVSPEETQRLMEADPAVMAGLFTFETIPWRSFPGDALTEPRFEPPKP